MLPFHTQYTKDAHKSHWRFVLSLTSKHLMPFSDVRFNVHRRFDSFYLSGRSVVSTDLLGTHYYSMTLPPHWTYCLGGDLESGWFLGNSHFHFDGEISGHTSNYLELWLRISTKYDRTVSCWAFDVFMCSSALEADRCPWLVLSVLFCKFIGLFSVTN